MKNQILYAPFAEAAAPPVPFINVSTEDELYAAVNDSANAGKTIVLAPGIYYLRDANNDPTKGRLDLQYNMTLRGQQGHPEQVVIDVTNLPLESYNLQSPPHVETAPIRMGNGDNGIEWMTIRYTGGDSRIRALIQTDIDLTETTKIRVAHTVLKGSNIGLCIINRYPTCNNRIIKAEIENNEIEHNAVNAVPDTIPRFASGIQIQNSHGVENAVIEVTMRNNYLHDNGNGIAVFNAAPKYSAIRPEYSITRRNSISIKSEADKIENNGIGLGLTGGFSSGISGVADGNATLLEANGTTIRNNQGNPLPSFMFNPGGVYAVAGFVGASGQPDAVNNNSLKIVFKGCPIQNNIGAKEINAFGFYSNRSSPLVGSHNTNEIHLHGISKQATDDADNSFPSDPSGTNTVIVNR